MRRNKNQHIIAHGLTIANTDLETILRRRGGRQRFRTRVKLAARANRKINAESDRVEMEGNSKCGITKPFDSSIHVYTIGLEYSIPVAKFGIFLMRDHHSYQ